MDINWDSVLQSNNNNNYNKTVLIKRLPPKSLSAKTQYKKQLQYTNI